ncbi:hypothetical protein ACOMHN_034210 [Nucella lapillus]
MTDILQEADPDRQEKRGEGCRGVLPTRYCVTTLGAVGLLYSIGFRKCFVIVLTHVTADQDSAESEELFFPNCTVANTSRDLHVPMGEDTMFLVHSAYYAGSPLFNTAAAALATTRVSPVFLVAVGVTLSSVMTISLPYVIQTSVPFLFVLRALQGAIDGIQQPCSFGVISAWSTGSDKARLCSIYFSGAYLAPALAALLSGITTCYISWNSIIFAYGVCGVVWSVMWVTKVYDTPTLHPSLSDAEAELHRTHGPQAYHTLSEGKRERPAIPWRHILSSPAVWAVVLGNFCHCHVYSMLVVEQAQYFADSFNMHIADIGLLTTMPHLGLSMACLLGGFLSDRLLHTGLSTTVTRKLLFSVGKLTEGACLVGLQFITDWQSAITLITLGVTVGGLAEAGYHPIPGDLSPQFAGVISAFVSIGTVGAFLNTFVASFILGHGKTLTDWQNIFLIAGVLDLLTVPAFDVMAQAELQPWGSGEPPPTTMTSSTMTSSTRKRLPPFSDAIRTLFQKLPYRKRSSVCESSVLFLSKSPLDKVYGLSDEYDSTDED